MIAWANDFSVRRPIRIVTEKWGELRARLEVARRRRERLQRLLENPDFVDWLNDDVTELQRNVRAKLFSLDTTGVQNDLCKIVLSILETFRLASVKNTMAKVEADMERLAKSLKAEERC